MRQFLDDRYTATDVKHSFQTKFGETIDCIDYFAQPGVKAFAAEGVAIKELPPPANNPELAEQFGDVMFDGRPDDRGKPRACPTGTVPILQITPAHVQAAGGIDSFLNAHRKRRGPPTESGAGEAAPPSGVGASYAYVLQAYVGGQSVVKATVLFGVYGANVTHVPDHSVGQTWMVGGPSNAKQTVEVGWSVDPLLYSGNNPSSPHLFIYSTVDGYDKTGCYNNSGSGCVKWISAPQAQLTPGMTLNISPVGSTPSKFGFTTVNGDLGYGKAGWNITGLGVYPSTDFSGAMTTSATDFHMGGEVYDSSQSWEVPMGSGASPFAGYTQAPYWLPTTLVTTNGQSDLTFSDPFGTQPNYSFMAGTTPRTGTSTVYYFGSMPNVWWGQNYGYDYSPVGDWAAGSYKGECNLGEPITGISSDVSAAESHALRCGENTIIATGNQCHTRTLGSSDNRGYTDGGWDWDVGSIKDECAQQEFVQGVSQDTSGKLNSVLCCPGNINHHSCNVETFGSGNSGSYGSGPDWDVGYYKGNCPNGKYVAGVSRLSNSVHAILCCQP